MRTGQRWVVDAFLAELGTIKLNEPDWPAHVVERRQKLAAMVLVEVKLDDPECFALRGIAWALLDLARWPDEEAAVERYLEARRCHVEVLQAAFDAG